MQAFQGHLVWDPHLSLWHLHVTQSGEALFFPQTRHKSYVGFAILFLKTRWLIQTRSSAPLEN